MYIKGFFSHYFSTLTEGYLRRLLRTFSLSRMTTDSDHRLTFVQLLGCTAVAGCLSRTLTAPLDVMKIKKQVGLMEGKGGLKSQWRAIRAANGIRGFWKGNCVGCIKIPPYSLIHYIVYQQLKWELSDDLGRMTVWKRLLTGITAGVLSTVVVYPLDLIKTRLIIQPYNKTLSAYQGLWDAFIKIYRREGPRSYYNGLSPTLLGTNIQCSYFKQKTHEYVTHNFFC